jgi:hypothetical protein
MEGAVYLIDSTSLTLTARSAKWARFSDDVRGGWPNSDSPISGKPA